jgi:uncharacterized protein YukE
MALNVNDADELLKFRNRLYVLAESLEKDLRDIDSQVDVLSEKWKDDQFTEFSNKFDEDQKELKPLIDNINEFSDDYLYPKEIAIREYGGGNNW